MPTCEETGEIDLGVLSVRSVERLRFPLTKDGEPWVGVDSATIVLKDPDGVQTTHAMSNETPDAGVWYYDLTITDVTTAGRWEANVRVTDGAVVKRYPYEIAFQANDEPGD